MIVGNRSVDEITGLLDCGYLTFGTQRITRESGPPFPDYRLWNDYGKREVRSGASDLATLIEMEHIAITEWKWYSDTYGSPNSERRKKENGRTD